MKKIFFIGLILVLAFVLRFMYLGDSLWYDEACSWFSAKQDFPFGIFDNLLNLDLQHTPLYFFMLHFWMKIFGQGEVALRLLSFIFGVLSVPLVYILSDKIFDRKVALYASLIMAVSPAMVIFSVEVRMYSMATFLVLLSLNYLIDFQTNGKNAWKFVVTNILIPYTFVGGIIYNISLFCSYFIYLLKCRKNNVKTYIKMAIIEFVGVIPFWCLILYYASKRSIFVVSHEGNLRIIHIFDILRNFFAVNLSDNIYWPSENYSLTLIFAVSVIVPCIYFLCGYIKEFKSNDKFIQCLCCLTGIIFLLFVLTSCLGINVLTLRYVLYLYPLLLILCVAGLFKSLNNKYFLCFSLLFILFSGLFDTGYAKTFFDLKNMSFKAIAYEAKELKLSSEDVIIMPFGADAPYYFRNVFAPKVYNFDFHKEVRNPHNNRYYDKASQEVMAGSNKYKFLYESISEGYIISEAYYNDFYKEVTSYVPKGRYVLLSLYGSDSDSVTSYSNLKSLVTDDKYVKSNILSVAFQKYMVETLVLLNKDFELLKSYKKGNYTYYLFQKM